MKTTNTFSKRLGLAAILLVVFTVLLVWLIALLSESPEQNQDQGPDAPRPAPAQSPPVDPTASSTGPIEAKETQLATSSPVNTESGDPLIPPSATPPVRRAPPDATAPTPIDQGPAGVSEALNRSGGTIDEDLQILRQTLFSFRTGAKQGNPVGLNKEITRTLTGRNRLGLAWVRRDHPAINDKGELCDRWGTPFFFHQESANKMGIRSAGPDQEMWTDDDVLTK